MTKERTVKISDIFWGVLSHWKAIIVFIIIGAIAGAGYAYLSSGKSSSEDGVSMSVGSTEKSLISLYVKYSRLFREQQDFIDSDRLMQSDPASMFRSSMIYYIDCEDEEKLDGLMAAYGVRLQELSDQYGEPNSFSIQYNQPASSSGNMSYTSIGRDGSFVISVVVFGTDATDCSQKLDGADDYIFEIHDELEDTFGKHSVTSFRGEMSKAPMNGVISRQKSAMDTLNSINTNMSNIKKNQDDDMVELLEYCAEKHPEYEDPENIPDKISTAESAKSSGRSVKKMNKKTIVLGAAAGFIVALVLFAIIYALHSKAAPEDDLQAMFGVPLLSSASRYAKRKRTAFDRFIDRKRRRRRPDVGPEGEAEMAVSNIRVNCLSKGISEVCATGCFMADDEKDFAGIIAEGLGADGIEFKAVRPILLFGDALEESAKAGNVVLIEKIDASAFADIAAEIQKCADLGINVIGIITVG